jgi:hypothetical protein
MKKIFLALSTFLFVGCVSTKPPAQNNPAIVAMQQIESQFSKVKEGFNIKLTRALPQTQRNQLTWVFAGTEGLSIYGDGANIEIKPAQDDQLTLKVMDENFKEISLQTARAGKVLGLRFHPYALSHIILAIPAQTKYLSIYNARNVTSTGGNYAYLSANDVKNMNFHASPWMLEALILKHVQQADLEGISTPYLLASIQNSGKIDVHGMLGLRELEVLGSGPVNMYWVNSEIFTVNVKMRSHVLLGGVSEFANMDVKKASLLDAKSLRVKHLFIRTHDSSKAAVSGLDSLNAQPFGKSNIYYYSTPHTLSRYYKDSGSVLYAGEAPPPCNLPNCPVPANVLPG